MKAFWTKHVFLGGSFWQVMLRKSLIPGFLGVEDIWGRKSLSCVSSPMILKSNHKHHQGILEKTFFLGMGILTDHVMKLVFSRFPGDLISEEFMLQQHFFLGGIFLTGHAMKVPGVEVIWGRKSLS